MADLDLTQFDGHTPGPWRWEFNAKHKNVSICGGLPTYDLTVLDFSRWGMGGAQPVFLEPGNLPTLHRLADRQDWVAPIPGREHHAHWCSTVTHPDARLMAAAPALLAEVKRQAAEIERLRGEAGVLRAWIAAALVPLQAVADLEDFEDGGEGMNALIDAGRKLAGPNVEVRRAQRPETT